MHFSTLLAASIALAPAVYGAGSNVVQVEVHGHEDCHVGRQPGKHLEEHETLNGMPDKVFPTEESCPSIKLPDHDEADTYSFTVTALNKKSFERCRGLGVYANKLCAGRPDWVVPFHRGELQTTSPCLPEYGFEDYASFQLICDDDSGHHDEGNHGAHGEGNKGGERDNEGVTEAEWSGEDEEGDKGEEKGEAEKPHRQAEQPAAQGNPWLKKLGL
ncbi:hypothetical protein ABOM_002462 [Aspergillus bombycis]|uniref:Uncharacterized protein n=1 Tax=Aspergillus bombycis TaxID=109264 RepID=A0A1F8AA43_9EURO|nr:hypothetical protein ABOM_002462 [Aspergillus bombycis]OGM48602.1 hypothetical protein ABOM_002462 [Aspergillus bombycis]